VYWLSVRRLRAHGTILVVCLWLFYAWNLAVPGLRDRNRNLKGTDFLHFYTLGSLAAAHRGADLYDMNVQATLAAQRVPGAAGIKYLPLYPPQVSILFAPLAYLSYGWALVLWWACSAAIYSICCYSIWRACPNLRDRGGIVVLLAAAFPAFFHLIAWGQTSALGLACFTLMFFLLRDKRELLAGLVLGCLIFKPQLGLAAAVIFVSIGAWKMLAGAAVSAAAQLSAGVLYYGVEPLRHWLQTLQNISAVLPLLEPKPYQTYSLRTFWSMLVPWHHLAFVLYGLSALFALGATIVVWKRSPRSPLSLRYSCLLLATVLVAPHLTVYDLVIQAPAFLLLADWIAARSPTSWTRGLGTLLYLAYALPLLGPSAIRTHIQLAVIAMTALIYAILSVSRDETRTLQIAVTTSGS
jgi:hypothetical protein